jgi:hypothetical protein
MIIRGVVFFANRIIIMVFKIKVKYIVYIYIYLSHNYNIHSHSNFIKSYIFEILHLIYFLETHYLLVTFTINIVS